MEKWLLISWNRRAAVLSNGLALKWRGEKGRFQAAVIFLFVLWLLVRCGGFVHSIGAHGVNWMFWLWSVGERVAYKQLKFSSLSYGYFNLLMGGGGFVHSIGAHGVNWIFRLWSVGERLLPGSWKFPLCPMVTCGMWWFRPFHWGIWS